MQRILIPLDGSPSSERAVKHVIALSKLGVPAEIHLLHVQPPVVAQDVPDIAKPGLMERLESTDAHHALDSAKRLLEEAGLRYSTRLDVGDPAELIVLYSKVHDCDAIVMGTRGLGRIKQLALGSVASKVVHAVEVPVTLVK